VERALLFSETLATLQPAAAGYTAEVGEDWLQGRAIYGGMVAALGNEAMRRGVPAERLLRGLEIVFAAPLLAGLARIDTEVLRVGKAVTIASARMWSESQLAATLTGIYGASRATEIRLQPHAQDGVPHWRDVAEAAIPAGAHLPPFLRHFDVKFAEGTRPFTGTPLRTSKVYIRHQDPSPLSESHLVALIDCIPPPLLQMMTTLAPSSSLTWTLEFIRHDYGFAPDAWWRIDTEVKGARDGYSQESSLLLDPEGRPAAFSRQLVAVFG
jgi:acyl-CoA thioesterase